MDSTAIDNTIENICANDIRYDEKAYHYIAKALSYGKAVLNADKHMTAKELATSYKDVALAQYGPLALDVLNHWGIYTTKDIGNIVFNMVNGNLLSTSNGDKLEDFDNIFDLHEEMKAPYLELEIKIV
jgi:uncharacterized repeat protein (TIGR04138 family)